MQSSKGVEHHMREGWLCPIKECLYEGTSEGTLILHLNYQHRKEDIILRLLELRKMLLEQKTETSK